MIITSEQRDMMRHCIGLPNKKKVTNRNHYCIGPGCDGYAAWIELADRGLAIRRTTALAGGDDFFHLTQSGATLVLDPKEHISREEMEHMRQWGKK